MHTPRQLLSSTPGWLGLAAFALACRTAPDKADETDAGLVEAGSEDADGDGFPSDEDCNDADAAVSPSQIELCDGIDNNCDGQIDEGVTSPFFTDADGDGYGDASTEAQRCSPAPGEVSSPGDCDDTNPDAYPGAIEVCDDEDNDCDGVVDNGLNETYYADADGDGAGDPESPVEACSPPEGTVANADDCDDADPSIGPGAEEVCNERDDDCDDAVDEGVTTIFYRDFDADGYGTVADTTDACAVPAGYAELPGDCDDAEPLISPAALEVCNGTDDDCDGTIDGPDAADARTWYTDADTDGYGDSASSAVACTAPSGTVSDATDCDDTNAAVSPAATEVCNSIDDNCDGTIDDDDPTVDTSTGSTWYADLDGDGYGDATDTVDACTAPSAYVSDNTDCDDTEAAAYPGADEPCSSTDDLDCDGALADSCTSCQEVLDEGAGTVDGLYTIDPDGTGGHSPVQTWCDMTTDGGGWTLVQRTVWDWSDSSQLATTQAQWAGTSYGDPAAGYAFRLAGDLWPDLQSDVEHMLVHTPRDASSGADCSDLTYIGTGGTYTVSSSSTTLSSITSGVTFANDTTLSTTDAGPSTTCVNNYDGIPWFYSFCCTTCPTFKGSYWSDEAHPMASYLDSTPDEGGLVTADVCPSGAALSSYGYEGVNVMAYYLR